MRFSSVVSREVTVSVTSVLTVKFCLEPGNVDDSCEEGMAQKQLAGATVEQVVAFHAWVACVLSGSWGETPLDTRMVANGLVSVTA